MVNIMPDEKKIIVDEDWKAQVQAEKEAAKQQTREPDAGETKAAEPNAGAEHQDPPMPPASFEMLVSTLAAETLAALGQFPHPVTGKAELHRNQAQYLIDTLDMLRQKSQGNLTPAEQQLVESVLHQLRMVFVAVANQPPAAP
jgi:hypothetical protein